VFTVTGNKIVGDRFLEYIILIGSSKTKREN